MRVFGRPTGSALRVRCPWCKVQPGYHCTVRGMSKPLRDALGHYVSHPSREEAYKKFLEEMEEMDRQVLG